MWKKMVRNTVYTVIDNSIFTVTLRAGTLLWDLSCNNCTISGFVSLRPNGEIKHRSLVTFPFSTSGEITEVEKTFDKIKNQVEDLVFEAKETIIKH